MLWLNLQVDLAGDFVGHIGGGDFIAVFTSADWHPALENILTLFEKNIPLFYSEEDVSKGGIVSEDRSGNPHFFNLLTLAIGVVQPDPDLCRSHHDVAEIAATAKHQAKQMQGNSLFVCRRRGPNAAFIHDDESREEAIPPTTV